MADRHGSKLAAERAAFAAIRGFSFLTLLVLALIIGFILVKGLRYSNEKRSTFLPYAEDRPDGLVLVVNAKQTARVLDFDQVYGMFTDEYINWSKIDGSDLELAPLAADPATEDGARAERFLFGEAPLWGGLVTTEADSRRVLEKIRDTPGAVAILPASALEKFAGFDATRAAKLAAVSIRRIVLATSPEAAELIDNRSLQDLDAAALSRLMSGGYANWSELGGPDLAISIASPPEGGSLARTLLASGLPTPSKAANPAQALDGQDAAQERSYATRIMESPGAAGYIFAAEAAELEMPRVVFKSRESGWNLGWRYLVEAPRLSGRVGGISTIIANTFFMLLLTIAIAGPIGVAAAVYLVEYAKQGPLVRILRLGTETLAGIPSIIFGLFGMLFFVDILGFGFGLASGCLTLTLMILPTIVRSSEEALKSVPAGLREGSLALGASKLQTIFRVAVPAAAPGILTGLILGIGRAVGETAALLFTMGSDYKLARGLFSSARALSTHVYLLFAEGISFDRAFASATVLVVIVLAFNLAAKRLVGRMGRHAIPQ